MFLVVGHQLDETLELDCPDSVEPPLLFNATVFDFSFTPDKRFIDKIEIYFYFSYIIINLISALYNIFL